MKYEARQGKHDDMIIAVALAVWWLSRPKNPPAQFSTYGYYTDEQRRPKLKGSWK
jgi:hypothetical protein